MSSPKLFIAFLILAGFGLTGCRDEPPELVMRFYLSSDGMDYGRLVSQAKMPMSMQSVSVFQQPVVLEGDIVGVNLARVEMGVGLLFQLSDIAARQLYRTTTTNQGKLLILYINDKPVGSRIIDGPIERGELFTFVEMNEDDLYEIFPKLQESIRRIQVLKAKQ